MQMKIQAHDSNAKESSACIFITFGNFVQSNFRNIYNNKNRILLGEIGSYCLLFFINKYL